MRIGLAFILFHSNPIQTGCSHVSTPGELFTGQICSPLSKVDKHSPDREGYIMRIGKERCERKAYPHRVYPDRNRIRLRVNEA